MTLCLMLDVDGVVVQGRPEDGLPWATSLKDDLGIDPERFQDTFFARYWDDIVVGRKGLVEVLTECMPLFSEGGSPTELINYWFDRDSRINETLLSDIAPFRSSGMKTYLATNQEHLRASFLMETLGLKNHVDGLYYSADLGVKKPDPSFFESIANRTGRDPADLLLVDDTEANVESARMAGWHGFHWKEGADLPGLLRQF